MTFFNFLCVQANAFLIVALIVVALAFIMMTYSNGIGNGSNYLVMIGNLFMIAFIYFLLAYVCNVVKNKALLWTLFGVFMLFFLFMLGYGTFIISS